MIEPKATRPVAEQSGLTYPNRLARWFLLAFDEVMGRQGLAVVLEQAGLSAWAGTPPPDNMAREVDFASLAALNAALEEVYGVRGGRGLALRIGHAAFAQGMKSFGAFAGMQNSAFQALAVPRRTRIGLDALVHVFNNFSDQRMSLRDEERAYYLVVHESPMAWDRNSEKPVCHALTGLFQEALRWASSGYQFHVQEIECQAAGDPDCIFKVSKSPIGQL